MADKHPNNNLKRSIGFGSAISIVIGTIIGSCIFFKQVSVVIYTLVTIGIFRFLPVGLIHRLSENTTAYLATKVFGTIGGKLLSAGIIISMMGTLNGKMLTFPRIVYAMARRGDLPFSKYLSYVTPKGKSPVVATLFIIVLAAIMMMFFEPDHLSDLCVFTVYCF
ncbi:MAG: Amino acid permease [Lactobacillus delbrueckii]